MIKKAIAIAGAGAILLSMAVPVFATGGGGWWWGGSDVVTIHNMATVNNTVTTWANTGHNNIKGICVRGGRILTGAAGATAIVSNDVNYNVVDCDGCDGDVEIHNRASVNNRVTTWANTGHNRIGGMFVGGGLIHTGDAGATSVVSNFVNTNLVGGVL